MENFLNYQCSDENWGQPVLSMTTFSNAGSLPAVKQRCQANARERDRTQKIARRFQSSGITNVMATEINMYSIRIENANNRIVIKIPFLLPSSVNMAFNTLRLLIPTEPPDRKLSKIEILRLAGSYITHLDNQLYTGEMDRPCLQKTDADHKNQSLCTFCWSSMKKDAQLGSTNYLYKSTY